MTDAELAAARLTALLDAEREIERLRAQRVLSNEDFARAFDMGLAAGESRATAAVVAYLRSFYLRSFGDICADMADNIERGKHRREEAT